MTIEPIFCQLPTFRSLCTIFIWWQ